MTKKKINLIGEAKDTMKLGIGSMAGLGAMGAMSSIPGMPVQAGAVTGAAGAGLTLLGVGRMAKSGMTIANILGEEQQRKRKSRRGR